jgi:hypothetical protein
MIGKRLLRAIAGVALTWGVWWGVAGLAWRLVLLVTNGYRQGSVPIAVILLNTLQMAAVGTLAGLFFTFVFARAERGAEVGRLSGWRVALWGALAGILFVPVLYFMTVLGGTPWELATLLTVTGWFAAFGASSGVATIALARRGELAAPERRAELKAE